MITLIVVGLATYAFLYSGNKVQKQSEIKSVSTTSVKTAPLKKTPSLAHQKTSFRYGATGNCRAVPKFISSLKMKSPAMDSRQADGNMGLQIRDYSQKDKTWQHPSWEASGYIGAFDRDNKGNLYVSPLPYVSLQKNPPEKQNQVYQIDTKTAEMSLFMTLPSSNKADSKNPFGVMGLYFDCDTQSLYVSSVAGSTPMQEKGVIFQIDLETKKIVSTFENIDVVGLGVFNTPKGKRLYFGSARDSSLYSVGLDQQGHFLEDKRYELSLSQLEGGDTTVIKKLKFKKRKNDFLMILQDMEFGFRLMAENRAFQKNYNFEFNKDENKWSFKGVSRY
ncbi:MAG: hypothetical protein V3V19_07715 [Cocleimonas sp.]